MTSKTALLLGIVGAAAAGVIIGILVAPEKGTNTRKLIGDTASDWTDSISDLYSTAKEELGNLASKGSKKASDLKGKFNDVKESYS